MPHHHVSWDIWRQRTLHFRPWVSPVFFFMMPASIADELGLCYTALAAGTMRGRDCQTGTGFLLSVVVSGHAFFVCTLGLRAVLSLFDARFSGAAGLSPKGH